MGKQSKVCVQYGALVDEFGITEGATVSDVMRVAHSSLHMDQGEEYDILVNGKKATPETEVNNNDRVEFVVKAGAKAGNL